MRTLADSQAYLQPSSVIDWQDAAAYALAQKLGSGAGDPVEAARRCFEWVRDEVRHSRDYGLSVLTCRASEVLRERSGYCYAKSHLLAALLRANGIAAGLCYQRLVRDAGAPEPFCLHGLNAVLLPGFGWYRIDPRGNRADVNAQFNPPLEALAFPVASPGEMDLPDIHADPLPSVVEVLQSCATVEEAWWQLPDVGEVEGSGG